MDLSKNGGNVRTNIRKRLGSTQSRKKNSYELEREDRGQIMGIEGLLSPKERKSGFCLLGRFPEQQLDREFARKPIRMRP